MPQEEGGCQDGIRREAAALAEIREDDRTRDVEGHDLDGQWRYGISVLGRKKPLQIEVEQNALYPALGKPSDEAFEKWTREYKSGFAFPQINNSKRWMKIPFLE